MRDEAPPALLQRIVEPRRRADGLSLRRAAERAGMSEASWRQLTRGGVTVRGTWTPRTARRGQLLAMAAAVGEEAFAQMAESLAAGAEEQERARSRVYIPDPAEEEILGSHHLTPQEKLHLVATLRRLRTTGAGEAGLEDDARAG